MADGAGHVAVGAAHNLALARGRVVLRLGGVEEEGALVPLRGAEDDAQVRERAAATGTGRPKNLTQMPPSSGETRWSTRSPSDLPARMPARSGRNAPAAGTISCPAERRARASSAVIARVPMSLATDIIEWPSSCASCERISQQPM